MLLQAQPTRTIVAQNLSAPTSSTPSAASRLSGHVASTSALPPTADLVAPCAPKFSAGEYWGASYFCCDQRAGMRLCARGDGDVPGTPPRRPLASPADARTAPEPATARAPSSGTALSTVAATNEAKPLTAQYSAALPSPARWHVRRSPRAWKGLSAGWRRSCLLHRGPRAASSFGLHTRDRSDSFTSHLRLISSIQTCP